MMPVSGYGGIGRRAGFRFQWETVQVRVLLSACFKKSRIYVKWRRYGILFYVYERGRMYISTLEKTMNLLQKLPEQKLETVYAFVRFIQTDISSDTSESTSAFGMAAKYANPELISKENSYAMARKASCVDPQATSYEGGMSKNEIENLSGTAFIPMVKENCTAEDYWNLPESCRANLINGKLYRSLTPNTIHQTLVLELADAFDKYVNIHADSCEVMMGPFGVNPDAEGKNWVEPDISVICDPSKLDDRGCNGAPDLVIEIVSPSSRRMDYSTKNALYSESGVREYWIVDPAKERTTIYRYEEDAAPVFYLFSDDVPVSIFPELTINVADLLK